MVYDVDPLQVVETDLMIDTVETRRHQELICQWLFTGRSFMLCGPPGVGKTMTLTSTLQSQIHFEMVYLNFSSSTTTEPILKALD